VFFLAGTFIMLVWPWIFLAIIWARGGVQMSDHVARVVKNHPQMISFVITLLGNIVSIIIGIIFSAAVVRSSQEWATNNDHITVFHISLISAFRNQSWPWGIKDHKYLLAPNRWLPVVLAGGCIATFALVPSGTTSLITSVSFYRTWNLTGTELDFSNADCVHSLAETIMVLGGSCDWRGFGGLQSGGCGGNDRLLDLLESGRSSVSQKLKIVHNSSFDKSISTASIVVFKHFRKSHFRTAWCKLFSPFLRTSSRHLAYGPQRLWWLRHTPTPSAHKHTQAISALRCRDECCDTFIQLHPR
jgi:hypothetical protein